MDERAVPGPIGQSGAKWGFDEGVIDPAHSSCRGIPPFLRASALSDPLKTQVLSQLDVIDYKGRTVVRLVVPKQINISFVGDQAFSREGSQTMKVEGRALLALQSQFNKA